MRYLRASLVFCAVTSAVELRSRYDVVVVGSGLKESLLASLLASHGKEVLQVEPTSTPGGESASRDLQQLAERTDGPGSRLSEQRVGDAADYSVERSPKMFMASGTQLQLLVASGAWQHMTPPGFKRVQRSLLYRRRPDGKADVHRVLANSEDVLKTRMLTALEKARVVQFYLWVEKYDETDPRTHSTGPLSKRSLDLHKMSAAKFLAFWELPKEALLIVTRGMALHEGTAKQLKRMPALDLVRKLKRYKDAYRTFPHMTSPYVYPVGGFGAGLAEATARVLDANGGSSLTDQPIEQILQGDDGGACGVQCAGARVMADCIVASPECAPERVAERYQVVRLYAVLNHPPNLCKDSTSCQLIVPGAHCGRSHDVYLVSLGSLHGVAPKGKWVVVASARVEGSTDGLDALGVAKRELAAVMPLLKPTRKLFAEVTPYYEPDEDAQLDNMVVMSSCDESSYFDSVEADVAQAFERVTGETISSVRR